MIKLKSVINNEATDDKTLISKLAEVAGCGKPAISKFKNDEGKEFKKFFGLVRMVKLLASDYRQDEFDLMIDYSKHLDVNSQSARRMLEYLDSNNLQAAKEDLIERMLSSKNEESKLYASIYNTDNMVSKGELNPFEALLTYKNLNVNTVELNVLVNIFSTYIYLDQVIYDQAFNLINDVINVIPTIEIEDKDDNYMKNMLLGRALLLKAEYHSRKKQTNEAVESCLRVLNEIDHDSKKAWAYLHLANSISLTDYEQSLNYLENGLSLNGVHEKVVVNLKRSHNFLNNLWNKEAKFINHESKATSDIHEVAFQYINKNETEAAINLLDSIDKDKCLYNELGFHYYLRGLITNNIEDFASSIENFNESGDVYFKQLPVMKLSQLNVDQSIIRLLAK